MTDKRFLWLAATCYPRRGPILEHGKEYAVADFGEELVAEWVASGAAKYAKKEKGGGE